MVWFWLTILIISLNNYPTIMCTCYCEGGVGIPIKEQKRQFLYTGFNVDIFFT